MQNSGDIQPQKLNLLRKLTFSKSQFKISDHQQSWGFEEGPSKGLAGGR
jgi:hypothetical protein